MHEHEHDHDHAHHCHPHSHEHTGDKPMSPEEVLALLNYMLDHNRHHADELHDICHALEDEGKAEAAAALVATSIDSARFAADHREELVRERTADVDGRIDEVRKRQERALHFRHGLIEDLEAGVISKDEYDLSASAYASRISEARAAVLELEREREQVAQLVTDAETALRRFARNGSIGELDRRKVVELVERIDVHEDKSVDVRFRIQDVLERAGIRLSEGEVA